MSDTHNHHHHGDSSHASKRPRTDEEDERSVTDVGDLFQLAMALIDIPSVTGTEARMAKAVSSWLEHRGWSVHRQSVDPDTQRENLFAHWGANRNPSLILCTHLDTVPPFFPASQDETHIYGRGACDTKSLLAAMLLAAQELVSTHGVSDIGLLLVVSEETDHAGMKLANELGLTPKHLIVGEPTESKMARRQKGIVKAQIECAGKASHSGYPETGVNALLPLLDILSDIRAASWPSDPVLGDTTVNFIIRHGGEASNVVPAKAVAELLARVVTSPEDVFAQLERIVGERGKVTLQTMNPPIDLAVIDTPFVPTEASGLVAIPSAIVNFNTDIPYFDLLPGSKAYLFGSGSILDAHTANEKMRKADLVECQKIYVAMAQTLLSQPQA